MTKKAQRNCFPSLWFSLIRTTKIEEKTQKRRLGPFTRKISYHSECHVNDRLLIYRRAIMPRIPARRPAAGLTLEAAPVKGTLEELASGWAAEGWAADSAGWAADSAGLEEG
jgi:hypothetical protein